MCNCIEQSAPNSFKDLFMIVMLSKKQCKLNRFDEELFSSQEQVNCNPINRLFENFWGDNLKSGASHQSENSSFAQSIRRKKISKNNHSNQPPHQQISQLFLSQKVCQKQQLSTTELLNVMFESQMLECQNLQNRYGHHEIISPIESNSVEIEWKRGLKSRIIFTSKNLNLYVCTTISVLNKKAEAVSTRLSLSAQKTLKSFIFKGQIVANRDSFCLSSDMSKISLKEFKLLGGGCATSKNSNHGSNNNILGTEASQINDIFCQNSIPSELPKIRPCFEFSEESFVALKKLALMKKPSQKVLEWLQNFLIVTSESVLIKIYQNQQIDDQIRKKLLNILGNMINHVFQSGSSENCQYLHIFLVGILKGILTMEESDKTYLRANYNSNDCTIYDAQLESVFYNKRESVSTCKDVRQGQVELTKNNNLTKLKDQQQSQESNIIFQLIEYRRKLSTNYHSCQSSVGNQTDRLLFAHRTTFVQQKGTLEFQTRFYALFQFANLMKLLAQQLSQLEQQQKEQQKQLINLLDENNKENKEALDIPLNTSPPLSSPQKQSSQTLPLLTSHESSNSNNKDNLPLLSQNNYLDLQSWQFATALLFSKHQGIVQIIKENFGLCFAESQHNQSAQTFLSRLPYLRFIASVLLKNTFLFISSPVIPQKISINKLKDLDKLISDRISSEKIQSINHILTDEILAQARFKSVSCFNSS